MRTDATLRAPGDVNVRFLVLFALYLGLFIGVVQWSPKLMDAAERITASAVAFFGRLLLLPVSSSQDSVTFREFTMNIVFECTGVHYLGIFAAAVFAFPGRRPASKARGLVVGLSVIFLVNILRLGMLGAIGSYFAGLFEFVHLYLWHGLFTIIVLGLWYLWVNGRIDGSRLFTRRAVIAVLAAGLAFWALSAQIGAYYAVLAALGNGMFSALSGIVPTPDKVIVRDGLLGYLSGEYLITSSSGLYMLNLAAFTGIAAAAWTGTRQRPLFLARLGIGLLLMVLSHLGLIAMDWSLEAGAGPRLTALLSWCIVLSSMVAPALAWLAAILLVRGRERSRIDGATTD